MGAAQVYPPLVCGGRLKGVDEGEGIDDGEQGIHCGS